MIRLEVIEKTENTMEKVLENITTDMMSLTSYYKEKLTESAASKEDLLCFESVPFTEKKSDNFQNIYILEKCIMDFLRTSEYPKKVRIVCENREVAELYKVVYNFYYPSTKAERLEDDNWD